MNTASNSPDWLNLDDIDDEELMAEPDPTDTAAPDPETPATEAAETAAPEAAESAEDEQDDAPEASPDGPEADASADSVAKTDSPTANAQTPEPTREPDPTPEPLSIKASRKSVTIDGVLRRTDGLLITADSEKRVVDLMRRGLDAESVLVPENIQLRKHVAAMEQARSAREVEADAMVKQLDAILDGGPDAVVAFLEDYARQRPVLKARAIEAAAHWKMEQAERATQPDPEEYHAAIAQEARDVIAETVRDQVKAAGLTDEDATALVARYGNRLGAFVVQVPHDMPEMGLRAGQYAVNSQTLLEELSYDISLRREAYTAKQKADALAKQQTTQQAAHAAKQSNAAVLKQAAKVTTKPNPRADATKPKAANAKQDWLASLMDDDDDE